MRHPDLHCYLVEVTVAHAVVAESPGEAERIACDELATSSPFETDRVSAALAVTPPPAPRALDALPSWRDAEPGGDPRRAWTLRRWLDHQRVDR